jgi:hypothetical protein
MGRLIRNGAVAGWLLVLVLTPPSQGAKTRAELNREAEARMSKDVAFLASDECEGRGPTTEGINKAADYIAARFKQIGLKPGFKNSYFQPFAITGAVGSLSLAGPQGQSVALKQRRHFQPLGYDQSGSAAAPVVFAGYGITYKEPAYDDYAGLDVKDKIVAVLRDTPRSGRGRTKEMADGAPFAAKLLLAQKKGAAGLLLINDAEAAADGDAPLDLSFEPLSRGGKHLLSVAVRREVLEAMLPAGQTLSALEKGIDRDLKPNSFELPGWTARLEVRRAPDAIPLKNVIGVLEGAGPLAEQTVVVGAHYDHLGYGGRSSNSRGKKRLIHHGADDNGSGTTGMIELARRFAAIPDRQGRRLVFVAFSGEELGLYGSIHYCKQPPFPLAETAAMFNLDMIGRLNKDAKTGLFRLLTEGHGTAKEFKELIDTAAKKHGFALSSQASGSGPSDHDSFNAKKVPVLFLWTGTHRDYHRPTDTADKINVEGMRRIVDLSEDLVTTLTRFTKPEYLVVKGAPMVRPSSGPRLGIRPGNYNDEKEGVAVDGVSPGGPAEKAGMKDGDRIVEIAGKPIKDINTYMQALAARKKGDQIEVVVIREKQRVTLKVNLE